MAIPSSAELPRVCASPEFIGLTEHVKRELQVSIAPNFKKPAVSNGHSGSETPTECSFKFRCQRSNSDFLITAREMLEHFLQNHNIHVYPSPTAHTHKKNDSFAEAFPHFDSKVLSTARTRGHGMNISYFSLGLRAEALVFSESMDMGRSDVMVDRRLRLASSSPDVKALFNSPAYIYNLDTQEDVEANYLTGPGPVQGVDYWTPLPPIVRHYFLHSLPTG